MGKVDALIARQKKLEERIKAAKAQERQREKRDDQKRAQIIGQQIQAHMQTDPDSPQSLWIRQLLDHQLTKPTERALFDLDPLPAADSPDQPQPSSSPSSASPAITIPSTASGSWPPDNK